MRGKEDGMRVIIFWFDEKRGLGCLGMTCIEENRTRPEGGGPENEKAAQSHLLYFCENFNPKIHDPNKISNQCNLNIFLRIPK